MVVVMMGMRVMRRVMRRVIAKVMMVQVTVGYVRERTPNVGLLALSALALGGRFAVEVGFVAPRAGTRAGGGRAISGSGSGGARWCRHRSSRGAIRGKRQQVGSVEAGAQVRGVIVVVIVVVVEDARCR